MSTAPAPAPVRPDTLGASPAAADAASAHPAPILVATDGRDASAAALLVAARLAERLGDPPQVLDVLEPLPVYGEMPAPTSEALAEERAATAYASVRRLVETVVGASWPTQVAFGAPAPTIAEVARERHAALVVLGIGRHRVVDRIFGSETALHVLRAGDRPVLAVGPEADGAIRRAVVAVDFGPASTRAAAIACRLLAPGGTLSLVHVKTRLDLSYPAWEVWDVNAGRQADEMLRRLAAALRHGTTGCDECGATGGRADVTIGTATLVGDPAAEVLDYAERVGAELVAVGTHGAGLVERLIVGSVAADVLRLTSARLPGCSVLACPEPSAATADRLARRLLVTTESLDAAEWRPALEAFARRNEGRRAVVETDDPALGAQASVRGYALLGATYDPHDRRAELMLGATGTGRERTHLTRTLGDVRSIGLLRDLEGHDIALRIEQPDSQTLVTFPD